MPELSIIVPVYKVEKYLPKCIDSILAQTFRDFELILIDDGSPDNCGAICDDYAARDSRIKVIHQENAGVSAARNAGLDIAAGTYLGFVDSDDWIEPEMYETMIATAKEKNVDVVVCGFRYTDLAGVEICDKGVSSADILNIDKMLMDTFGLRQKLFYGAFTNKLIKSEVISKTRFRIGIALFEDCFTILELYKNCKKIAVIRRALYNYNASVEGSQGKTVSEKKILSSFKVFYEIIPQYRDGDPKLYSAIIERYLDDASIFIRRIHSQKRISTAAAKMKLSMIKLLVTAAVKGSLPKTKLRKYLVEGVFYS